MTNLIAHLDMILDLRTGLGTAAARKWLVLQPERNETDLFKFCMNKIVSAEAAEAAKAKKIAAAERAREKTRAMQARVRQTAHRQQRLAAEAAAADQSATNIVTLRPTAALSATEQEARAKALARMSGFKSKKGRGGSRRRAA